MVFATQSSGNAPESRRRSWDFFMEALHTLAVASVTDRLPPDFGDFRLARQGGEARGDHRFLIAAETMAVDGADSRHCDGGCAGRGVCASLDIVSWMRRAVSLLGRFSSIAFDGILRRIAAWAWWRLRWRAAAVCDAELPQGESLHAGTTARDFPLEIAGKPGHLTD